MSPHNLKLFWVVFTIGVWQTLGCTLFNFQLGPTLNPLEEKVILGEGDTKVLLVEIEGMIWDRKKRNLLGSSYETGMVERVREILRKAAVDKEIRAILLRVNSPGGTVTSSDIIFHELKSFKQKNELKIYAMFMEIAASGGYYISLAADTIFAHPTSMTGSIGVIAMKVNLKGLMEKIGVDMEVVKSGEKKDFLSPMRPFTKEERRLFQDAIDSYHNRFVKLIAKNRPELDQEKVSILADGRVYNSSQALENKLIDRIGYLEDALEKIKKDLGVTELKVISYYRTGEYKPTVYSKLPQASNTNVWQLDFPRFVFPFGAQFMYLWFP